jgi:hypothetical protein
VLEIKLLTINEGKKKKQKERKSIIYIIISFFKFNLLITASLMDSRDRLFVSISTFTNKVPASRFRQAGMFHMRHLNSKWYYIQTDEAEGTVIRVYPNPFTSAVKISFHLASSADVNLSIFDNTGKKQATLLKGKYPAGENTVSWDAGNYPSGIYIYRLKTDYKTSRGKLIIY